MKHECILKMLDRLDGEDVTAMDLHLIAEQCISRLGKKSEVSRLTLLQGSIGKSIQDAYNDLKFGGGE